MAMVVICVVSYKSLNICLTVSGRYRETKQELQKLCFQYLKSTRDSESHLLWVMLYFEIYTPNQLWQMYYCLPLPYNEKCLEETVPVICWYLNKTVLNWIENVNDLSRLSLWYHIHSALTKRPVRYVNV